MPANASEQQTEPNAQLEPRKLELSRAELSWIVEKRGRRRRRDEQPTRASRAQQLDWQQAALLASSQRAASKVAGRLARERLGRIVNNNWQF